MVRKTGIIVLVLIALLTAACGAPATGVANDNGATPDAATNGNEANTNAGGLDNTNDANSNSAGSGNTNDANTNDSGLGNTNDANTNTGGGNTNAANTNSAGNTNANTNGSAGTPGAPAGTGLTAIQSYDAWVQAMEDQGQTVTPMGEPTEMSFSGLPAGTGRAVTLGDGQLQVQVIEFQDEATRQTVSNALAAGQAQLADLFPGMTQPSYAWANGNVLVIYFGDQSGLINQLTQMMGAPIVGASATGGAPADLLDTVQQWLAGQLSVNGTDIQLVSVQPQTFTDACLGLGTAAESCALVQTPGWVIVYSVNGQQHTAHVSQDGATMRLKETTP